ncbi:hypothetical protein OCU04_001706 [Sclerotinia nivalis]|uniref:Myb-like domain-containing protein n=1 Tax=Sclerotinia nivalis TaxID=352851 RepID=A0A9X0AYN4_9HELO|nr:hypothetical protein OCU04_001706 [Sclerotinia nivalis]
MSTSSESPKQAAETAPAVPRAKGKAAADNPLKFPRSTRATASGKAPSSGRRWTQEERDSVLLQICLQAGGENFVPDWAAIHVAGRSERSTQHVWNEIKKSAAGPVVGESENDGDSNDKKRKNPTEEAEEVPIKKKSKVAKKAAAKAKAEEAEDGAEEKPVVDKYFDIDA